MSRMACRMAGMLGCGGGPPILFFPPRGFKAAGLEEGVGDHRHQCVSMQTGPGPTFEVIEAEFLLELLMRLLTDPSGFDRGGELLQACICWQVRHIVFLLARRPAFADEPDLVARHALHTIVAHAVLVAIRNANRSSREETCQPAFGSPPPTDLLPFLAGQRRFSGDRRLIGDAVFAGLPCFCDRERQSDICRVDVLASRQPHCP